MSVTVWLQCRYFCDGVDKSKSVVSMAVAVVGVYGYAMAIQSATFMTGGFVTVLSIVKDVLSDRAVDKFPLVA